VELPRLEPLWRKYRDKGLSIVAVEATRDRDRAVEFVDKHGLTYHLLEAEEEKARVKERFGLKWFPTSFLLDRDGKIVMCHVGFHAGDEVQLEKDILSIGEL
jgi:peroxiredoxin